MVNKTLLTASVIGLCTVVFSSAVAQANPATPMPAIDAAATQLCDAMTANPTPDGALDGLNAVARRGLDDMDGALVMITAVHHVCPQHESLLGNVLDPIAAKELCTESL